MTNVDTKGRGGTAERHRSGSPERKAVLFCPVCGFEAPAAEEWIATGRDGHRALACPNCGTVVASR